MAPLHSLPPPSKKRRVQKDPGSAQSIKLLEQELTLAISKNASLNPLADLLDLAITVKDPQDTSKAIYALYRLFVLIITDGKLGLGVDEAAKVVKAWLLERLNVYVDFLACLLKDEEKFLRISALQILLSLQKHLSTSYSKSSPSQPPQPQFHIAHFRKITSALILCPPSTRSSEKTAPSSPDASKIDPDVLHHFHETWFSVHDDVRWFFLREAATILINTPHEAHNHIAYNILAILERLNTFPTEQSELDSWWVTEMGAKPKRASKKNYSEAVASEDEDEEKGAGEGGDDDDWRKFFDVEPAPPDANKSRTAGVRLDKLTIHQSIHALSSHRAVFTRAWLALLPRLSMASDPVASKTLATRVLHVMHRGVMPHLTRPVLVMDWVGACVDFGGTVGLLALNALFVLMKDYNLDYPSFYTRLYAFIDRDVLHLKHRARFFRMTELFLGSTHIPALLLASFIKRLARLSLAAPPSAIIMVIPFTYNILKRHPALMAMIHRDGAEGPSDDPFLSLEPNPLLTQALSSSLWELQSHKMHYHSGVSTLVKIFSEAFTKPGYAMEDFLDHTYGTLIEADVNRKIKKEPALAFEMPKNAKLFPARQDKNVGEKEEEEEVERDVVGELWIFG